MLIENVRCCHPTLLRSDYSTPCIGDDCSLWDRDSGECRVTKMYDLLTRIESHLQWIVDHRDAPP